MLRVYYLPVETINGTEQVAGLDLIHDALLLCTINPEFKRLLMDTTPDEHDILTGLADMVDIPTQEETDLYIALVDLSPPDPDFLRARVLLSTSPAVIAMPDIWELLRIIGKRLGY